MSGHLARLLKQAGQGAPEVAADPRGQRRASAGEAARSRASASTTWPSILFDQALLAEGGQLEDPAAYVKRVNALLLA